MDRLNDLNSTILEGVTVGTIENGVTSQGNAYVFFDIESKRYHKGEPVDISTFSVEGWHDLAESAAEKLSVGRKLRIVGRIKQLRWTENGKEQSKVKVIADHIEYRPLPTVKACTDCLWAGVECKNKSLYKPASKEELATNPLQKDCGAWTYYD